MIFKCKMCGGALEIPENNDVFKCLYCGTQQTLPTFHDERKNNLYDRANHLRQSGYFDKAVSIYEIILEIDPTDAEVYWSLVLCKYGVEYVEDPKTKKRIPTCNRTQFTPVFADPDYQAAINHASAAQQVILETEAIEIDRIQKGLLSISQKEEPFDIFICYKESDDSGNRTPDSVIAQELYYELTEAGFRVFFSRITLENQLGTEYEPYIFAALNSSRVMVVISTKADYVNAPWVKNEWSRYLNFIKNGEKKTLIPAYKDMDPYDLPEEFSHLQAQDMSKLGFMQDLIRGIHKVLSYEKNAKSASYSPQTSPVNISALLERAFLSLEDQDWKKADELLELVLNQEPKNARAYIGKLMIERQVCREDQLSAQAEPLEDSSAYQKALRFADKSYQETLHSYNSNIIKIAEAKQKAVAYQEACEQESCGNYNAAYHAFQALGTYQDSAIRAEECLQLCKKKLAEIKVTNALKRQEREQAEEARRIAEETHKKKNQKNDLIIGIAITLITICILGLVISLSFKMAATDKAATQSESNAITQNRVVTNRRNGSAMILAMTKSQPYVPAFF